MVARPQAGGGERSELLAPATSVETVAGENPEEVIADAAVAEQVGTQEVASRKTVPAPTRPSAADVEDHSVTHMPYRRWCDSCVESRGSGEQRGRHVGRAHGPPRVEVDYWHITIGNPKLMAELADEHPLAEDDAVLQAARREHKVMKGFMARCYGRKPVFAHAASLKGDDAKHYVADLVATDVAPMGHV